MFKILRHNKGQASMSQYVVVFFLAIGAVITMSTFVQRSLQARIEDARNYMITEARNAHGDVNNTISYEYEPYYGNVQTRVDRNRDDQFRLLEGGATGIFRKSVNEQVVINTASEQAPPRAVAD